MEIKNVIFDLDGTLIDSFPGIEQAYQTALLRVLPERTAPDIKNLIGPPIHKIFGTSLQLEDTAIVDELVQEFKMAYDAVCWQNTIVYEGVNNLLQQLKNTNINLFIVTNKRKLPALKILEYFNLAHFFTEIITPDAYQPPFTAKRHTLSFLLNKYQMPVESTIFVGDSEDDSEAAAANAITFVAAAYGYGQAHSNPFSKIAFTIQHPEQLLTIIDKN